MAHTSTLDHRLVSQRLSPDEDWTDSLPPETVTAPSFGTFVSRVPKLKRHPPPSCFLFLSFLSFSLSSQCLAASSSSSSSQFFFFFFSVLLLLRFPHPSSSSAAAAAAAAETVPRFVVMGTTTEAVVSGPAWYPEMGPSGLCGRPGSGARAIWPQQCQLLHN